GSSISLKPSAHGGTLNESELNNRLNALGISSSEWVNYFETPNSGQFQETHFSEGCLNGIGESSGGLAPNYGVAQQPDGDGYVTTNNAYAICPPQGTSNQEAFPPADQGTIVNVKWLTAMAPIPGNPSIDWTRTNCNQAQPPQVPTEVALYHHHDDGEITFSHYAEEHIYTGPENAPENDPDYVVANDPLYNCSDYSPSFTVGSKDYNKNMENLPDESLFASLVNELGCDWEDVVRDEAISLGMNSAAFFEASFADQTITQLTGEPAECATFWEDPGEPNDGDLIEVAGNPYPSGVVPAECEHSACHVEFIGFDGDGSGGAGEVEIDLEKAAQDYGFETIRAFYPRASWNCEDNDCVNLDVAYEGQSMVSRGTVQVPMNLLLGESVELSYEEAETFEGELAR
ncbi:MAG: hypothetical protein KDD55_03665, partial [Bdellovibrionales bacterium]|nr:hypothetical protein [Bdellovibrionales bacterium]